MSDSRITQTGQPEPSGRQYSSVLVRLLRDYAWRYRWSYLAGLLFLWLTNYLTVLIPIEIGRAVDALRSTMPLGGHVGAIAVMGVVIIGVRTLSRILIFNPGRHLEYHLRQDLFARLLRHQPSFYSLHKRGDIVSRASNDIGSVRTMIGYGGLQVVNVTVAVILTGWKMLALSPRLTVMVLLPVVLAMTVVQWSIRRLFYLSRRNQEQLGEISEHVLGSLQGIATIQSFVAEDAFIRGFDRRNQSWIKTGMKLAVIRSLALPLLVLSGGVALFALIAAGGMMVQRGLLTIGELTAFTALLTVLLPPLRSLGWMLSVIQRGRAALERIFELIDAPVDRPEGAAGKRLQTGRGPTIELRDLSFAYPDQPQQPVLQGLTVSLPAGAMVGLCGRTGSGKSTLLRLVSRLYNPPVGAVLVDGHDINGIDLDQWRERLAVVPQRPFLFSDSVAFNVAMSEQPELDQVGRAVTKAALDSDLKVLPDGLETVVGERGIMLSGGQRQRVALARGLLREGDLLILDDVMSAVDHATEAQLVETLKGLSKRAQAPTVLIASHRLSALRHADLILVLDRGRLVDHGRHEELLARPGIYSDTWRAQTQRNGGESAQEAS
jgi:ATP-binding cassette subfamily B protein